LQSLLDIFEEFLGKRLDKWEKDLLRRPASVYDSAARALHVVEIPQKRFHSKVLKRLHRLKPNNIEQVQRQKNSKQAGKSAPPEEMSESNLKLRSGKFRVGTHDIEQSLFHRFAQKVPLRRSCIDDEVFRDCGY